MELQLKNIGMIKEANVKIDGLTVIAGENSTGKSTIGKLLFSLIKSTSRYNEDLEESKEDKILHLVQQNYFALRKEIDFSVDKKYQQLFSSYSFSRDIRKYGEDAINERINFIKDTSLSNIEKNLLEMKKILLKDSDIEEAQKSGFKKALISEFNGRISTKNNLNELTSIKINEGKNKILDIELLNDKIEKFNFIDELSFSDATFIESPIVLQLSEIIKNSKTYFEESDPDNRMQRMMRPNIPLHIKDLDNKLKIATYEDNLFDIEDLFGVDSNIENILSNLSSIMDGRFEYVGKEKDFKYISQDGNHFNSLNTATGIKAFGIIQMLIKSEIINQNSLLILDEPEVHLHPKWQLKYAELIVELVNNNVSVLVTSHSPYMIEALQRYSGLSKINSDFYLAEDSYIKKINNSNSETLSEIFEKLSEPFDIFEEMESERFQNG